jgi:hypothetical protein
LIARILTAVLGRLGWSAEVAAMMAIVRASSEQGDHSDHDNAARTHGILPT